MAKAFLQVQKEFTRSIGGSTLVGHPKHPDPHGKFLSVEDGPAVDELVTSEYAKRITEKQYQAGIAGTELADAGENRLATLQGKYPKVSATWSTARLIEEAARRPGVSIAAAGNDRAKIIKILNDHADEAGTGPAEGTEGTDTTLGSLGTLTSDTTGHPDRVGPQNDVNSAGSVDKLLDGQRSPNDPGTGLEADDAAPLGGEGSGADGNDGA